MTDSQIQAIRDALDHFQIETPSWGFADTGTRFGKFLQDAAAIDINDKLADAGQVHAFTGICPSAAVHVLGFWRGSTRFRNRATGSSICWKAPNWPNKQVETGVKPRPGL